MNHLLPGKVDPKKLELLISLTSIRSEDQKGAICDYYINGGKLSHVAYIWGIPESNFNRALKRVNDVAGVVHQIEDIDFERFKSDK